MYIEFSTRWAKLKEKEMDTASAEDRRLQRLLGADEDSSEEPNFTVEYEYTNLVIDLLDVKAFNEFDKNHVVIRTTSTDVYTLKCKYRLFKQMWQQVTGSIIKNIDDFEVEGIPKVIKEYEKTDYIKEILNNIPK